MFYIDFGWFHKFSKQITIGSLDGIMSFGFGENDLISLVSSFPVCRYLFEHHKCDFDCRVQTMHQSQFFLCHALERKAEECNKVAKLHLTAARQVVTSDQLNNHNKIVGSEKPR